MHDDCVMLSHGAGGVETGKLIAFVRECLGCSAPLDDAFVFTPAGRAALTTDGFVVTPRFFPGGDIGKLAVCGTANDLACLGARLGHLALALIIEEGLPLAELGRALESLAVTATACGATVVTGDCKVVGRGQADGLFIVTTGYGEVEYPVRRPLAAGDALIITGTAGDHGMAILTRRAGLHLTSDIASDCAVLWPLVEIAARAGTVKFVRDATRGGVAAVLNEMAREQEIGVSVEDDALPVRANVRAACGLLGFDPWHMANEGKMVMAVAEADANLVLAALRGHELGRDAAIIGKVRTGAAGRVMLATVAGSERLLLPISGEPLPRIC